MRLPKPEGLDPVYCDVLIEADGFGIGGAAVSTSGEAGVPVDVELPPVRLKPEAPLTLTFIGPDGKPVPELRVAPRSVGERGVPVFARAGGFAWIAGEARQRLTASTDATGTCTLRGLPRQSVVQLEIDDDRFARLTYNDRAFTGTGATRGEHPVRLTAAASIVGHVRYGGTGAPAAGVNLTAQGLSRGGGAGWGNAVTNERGEYEIARLPRGSYNVFPRLDENMAKDWTASAVEVTVAEGERREHQDLTLIKGGVIEGKVVLKDTGAGAKDVYVGLHGPSRPESGAAIQGVRSGEDGRFMFRVPSGENAVYVSGVPPEGYLRPAAGSPRALLKLQVADGQTVPVTLELPRDPSPVVSGVVEDEAGKPVAGATVSAEGPEDFTEHRFTKTDGAGQYRLAAPKGSKLRAMKGPMRTADAFVTRGAHEELVLRVHAAQADASVVLTVAAAGKPVKGAKVRVMVHQGGGASMSGDAIATDDHGRCLIDGLLADGQYSVEVEAEGFAKVYPELKVTAGKRVEVAVSLDQK